MRTIIADSESSIGANNTRKNKNNVRRLPVKVAYKWRSKQKLTRGDTSYALFSFV